MYPVYRLNDEGDTVSLGFYADLVDAEHAQNQYCDRYPNSLVDIKFIPRASY